MPARKNPPPAHADRVRDLYRALTEARESELEAKISLYRAVYEANLDGWSDGALAERLGVPRRTVQGWREAGRRAVGGP